MTRDTRHTATFPEQAEARRTFRRFIRFTRDWGLTFFVLGLLVYAAVTGAASSGYNWQWDRVLPYFWECSAETCRPGVILREGLVGTLRISGMALCISLCAGSMVAMIGPMGGGLTRTVCFCYIQLVRNTPLVVQLVAVYALMPPSWGLSAEGTAVLVLGLFEGAYMAEIFRAGIAAVPKGQWEAARSLGLPDHICRLRIILPQALRHSLPPLVSQCVSLIKDSALVGVIAVTELSQRSGLVVSETFLSFETWLPTAGIYLILALGLSALAALLHKRLSRGIAAPCG